MDGNKAGYWFAVGVLALGLNSEYRQGNFVTLHRVAERAGVMACRITARADETLAATTGRMSRGESAVDSLLASTNATTALRDRSEVLRQHVLSQAEAMRARAEMRRVEIEQMRSRRGFQFVSLPQRVKVVCPKLGTRIVVSRGPDLRDVSADVDVSENF